VLMRAAYHLPPGTTTVAAAIRVGIDQEPGDGVLPDCLEEILAGGRRSEGPADGPCILVKRAKDFVLLLRCCGGEFFDARKHFVGPGLHFSHSFGVKLFVITREGGECAINKIDNSRLVRAGRLVSGNDAGGDGIDFRGQIRREEFEPWRNGRLRKIMRVLRGCKSSRPTCSNPSGRDTVDTVEEKSPARKSSLHARAFWNCGTTV